MPRLLAVVLLLALSFPAAARAQAVPLGWIVHPEDCSPVAVFEEGGELYAQHLDGTYGDWLAWASAKGGPLRGMTSSDVYDNIYSVLPGAFARSQGMGDTTLVLTTFPGGGLHLDSLDIAGGWGWFESAQVQQLGDTPPASASSAEPEVRLSLPDELASWEAGLETGPAWFPRLLDGRLELAFAPLRELDFMYPDRCTAGGLDLDPGTGEGLLAGYNLYRLEARERPELEELGAHENWLDFIEMPPAPDSQALLHDPDGTPFTGDEVLIYLDGELARDGSPRRHGEAAEVAPGRRYWYAVQAVARGSVEDFAELVVGRRDPVDLRADLDGDGSADAVDLDGPDSPNGPEFLSPQADRGEPGLGLTNGGRAHLSKRMAIDVTQLLESVPQLLISGDELLWGGGPQGATSWRLRRSERPEDLGADADADADAEEGVTTEWIVEGRSFFDAQEPGAHAGLLCYRVEAVE